MEPNNRREERNQLGRRPQHGREATQTSEPPILVDVDAGVEQSVIGQARTHQPSMLPT